MTSGLPDPRLRGAPPLRADGPDPLRRYRLLQAVSLLLILGGLVVALGALLLYPGLLGGEAAGMGSDEEARGSFWLIVGGIALLTGLIANAVRSIVVREALPPSRYRGPSIIVLLLLAIIFANVATLAAANDLIALTDDGRPSAIGSLALLTVTQLGLLGTAALFVGAPRALAGVRFLPPRGLRRSALLGLVLAIPAWIGAQLIGYIAIWALARFGMEPTPGLAEAAISRVDPVVLVLALVVVAPVAEEIFFRGIAYNAWLREYGPRRALWGSAILFAFIHGSVFVLLPIVALGVALALVYRSTGSLPAAIALHAGFNAITVTIGLLVRFNVLDLPIT